MDIHTLLIPICPSTWRLDSVCRHAPHHMYSIRKYPVN